MSNYKIKEIDVDSVKKTANELNIPFITCAILYGRGVTDRESITKFLNLNYSQNLDQLSNVFVAAEYIFKAIKMQAPIIIHGDYDVDGICSTSILFDFLFYQLGYKKVIPYIPSRIDEGYGISEDSLESIVKILQSKWPESLADTANQLPLIISVDCGIKDISLIDDKWANFFDFIITDHHLVKLDEAGEKIFSQRAKAIVHPLHPKSRMEFTEICGAFVTFKLISALNTFIGGKDNIEKYLPLVALATNCDIMPLIHENRSIVKYGLANFHKIENLGLKYLIELSGLEGKSLNTYHLGFNIGPRINATGRIGDPLDGVRLLVTKDATNARTIAKKLNELNQKRQFLTKNRVLEAELQAEQLVAQGKKIIVVYGEGWEEGIVGLIAGKISTKYSMPAFALSLHGEEAVGSARSIEGINIVELLEESKHLLSKFGGHSGAAGLTLHKENIGPLIVYLNQLIVDKNLRIQSNIDEVDFIIGLDELNEELIGGIEMLEPFGKENEAPNFLLKNLIVESINFIGDSKQHLKILASDKVSDIQKWITYFNFPQSHKSIRIGMEVDVIATVSYNEWNGIRSIQINAKNIYPVI